MRVRIEPATSEQGGGWRPTFYMERVSRHLETRGELSKNAIETDIRGKATYIRDALAALEADGYVTRRDGPRGSSLYRSARPYREADEPDA